VPAAATAKFEPLDDVLRLEERAQSTPFRPSRA